MTVYKKLKMGWTHWEWTVHVYTLYMVYTLKTMYTLYTSYCSVSKAVSLFTREKFQNYNLQFFDKMLKYDDIFIWIRHVNNISRTNQNHQVNFIKCSEYTSIFSYTPDYALQKLKEDDGCSVYCLLIINLWDSDKSLQCHCWQSSPCQELARSNGLYPHIVAGFNKNSLIN